MDKYRITPERIGRRNDIPPFTVVIEDPTEEDAQHLAEALHTYAKAYLLSQNFDVSLDLRTGKWFIAHGRFGKGTVEKIEAPAEVEEPADV